MKLRELFEAADKHIAFCFGRMNPPTIGHKQLLETVAGVGGDYKIFVSQTQDKKKNPLDYGTKIGFMKAMFPEYASNIVQDAGLNTVVKVAAYLYEQGYRHATFVAGSDRLEDMSKLLKDYNGVEGKTHGFYKFETLDFKSSGDREDGAEGVAGISASGARLAAANGDLEAFAEATGAGQYTEKLYAAVRKGMGLKESMSESILREFAPDDGSGGEEDTLLKYARMWYNGDEGTQQKVEQVLDRMGWEIGEIESEEGGAFVVQAGDENGDSYIGFAPEDLSEGFMSFLKGEPPKKKWNPATDSRVISNKKDDNNWIKLLLDKKRRGIELTDREWHDLETWKLKQSMKTDDVEEHIVKVKGGYELKSKHGNKNLGKYPTKAGAEKRERQIQFFKHRG